MRSRRAGNAPRRNVGKRTAYRRVAHAVRFRRCDRVGRIAQRPRKTVSAMPGNFAHPTTVHFSGINPSTFAISSPNLYLSQTANEVTMLRDDINSALKDAMKAKDERRVSTLRLVHSNLKNADIEARGQGKGPPGGDAVFGVLRKVIKQRPAFDEPYT